MIQEKLTTDKFKVVKKFAVVKNRQVVIKKIHGNGPKSTPLSNVAPEMSKLSKSLPKLKLAQTLWLP